MKHRLSEYWLGNKTLLGTFFFLLLIPSVAVVVLQRSTQQLQPLSSSPYLIALSCLLLLLYTVASIATLVGINRKSRLAAGAYGANTNVALYNLLSLIVITYTTTHIIDLLTTNVEPSISIETTIPSSPTFTLDEINPGVLHMHGPIGNTATKRLETYLASKTAAETQINQLLLNSKGGNIFEARGLARVVTENRLNTHVDESCLSACTLVYVSGIERSAGRDARFGFHSYGQENDNGGMAIDVSSQQELDKNLFAAARVSAEFIDQLYQADHHDMWFAELGELVDSGFINKPDAIQKRHE